MGNPYAEQSEYWRGVNNSKARERWAALLASYSWDAFLTCTPSTVKLRSHPLSILRRIRRAVDFTTPVCRLFLAAEEFKLGGWHGHGLVSWSLESPGHESGGEASRLGERLSKIGFSRVESAKSVIAVSNYLSKYVIKDSPWEWEIGGAGW